MKCLYCGKELALLKRLSGSEFCSDGHRKLYQQEYNQLALNRLISNGKAMESGAARSETLVITPPPEPAKEPAQEAGAQGKNGTARPNGVTSAKNGATPTPAPAAHEAHTNGTATKPTAVEHRTAPEAASPARGVETPKAAPKDPPKDPPTPKAPPAPKENLPPFAGFVDSKPPARLGIGLAPSRTPLEPVTAKLLPVHPTSLLVDPHADLEAAASIPFASKSIIAKPGAVEIEDQSEPREFGVTAARMEPVLLLTLPVLQNLLQPFPINASPRSAVAASLWTAPATRWERTPGLVKESIHAVVLEPVEFDFQTLCTLTPEHVEEVPEDFAAEALAILDVPVTPELVVPHDAPTPEIPAAAVAPVVTENTPPAVFAPHHGVEVISDVIIDRSFFQGPSRSGANSISTTKQSAVETAIEHSPVSVTAIALDQPPPAVREPKLVQTPLPVTQNAALAGPAKPIPVLFSTAPSKQKALLPDLPAFPIRPVMAVTTAGKAAEVKPSAPAQVKNTANPAANKQAPVSTPPDVPKREAKAAEPASMKPAQAAAPPANRPASKTAESSPQNATAQQKTNPQPTSKQAPQPQKKVTTPNDPVAAGPSSTGASSSARRPDANRSAGAPSAKAQVEKPAAQAPPKDIELPPFPTKPNEPALAEMDFKLPELHISQPKPMNRNVIYAAAGAAALVVLVIVAFYAFPMTGSSAKSSAAAAPVRTGIGAGPEWIEDFSPDALHPRTISLLRSTSSYKDYRIEMEAQIDRKALGWVFRAKDAKNFQVAKIEWQPQGFNLNPALVHYAVVNGTAEPRKQVPLGITVSPSTVYRLRFEASGNKFTAYVQDRKVDEWTDTRFPSGGAGLYSDNGERAILQSAFDVTPAAKKSN
ncbi:MAG: hypothetical protein ABL967_14430 [Bryobacteraceae bacterium]